MLIFCAPRSPATADIVAFHRDETVDHYEGSSEDIVARVNAGAPGRTVTARPLTNGASAGSVAVMGSVIVMCLTLANATAIIDHHPSFRPTGRAYIRTFHHAAQLSAGYLWSPDPDRDPHTVTEVHRTRDRRNGHDRITLVDQYANPYSYRSDGLVPTAIADLSTVYHRCICKETTR